MTGDRLLRIGEVISSTGLSRRSLYRMVDRGDFPRQVQIGANMVAWRQSDVDRWIADPMGWAREAA
jgi:prophage regulatory protein